MKHYTQIFKSLIVICIGILFLQCSNNKEDVIEKTTIPLFKESDMSLIHNDSEKSWHITEVINKYYDPNYELEINLDCVTDDVYTFSATDENVQIDLGEVLCFADIDDGIFTADNEIFESQLMFMDGFQGETIYLHFARGYTNEDHTASGATSTYYALAELSEDRMVFHRGGGLYIGEYNEALIFERIQ
ncbi:hypothetical protein [Yeosuana marina]|uniref:hypothetical protein n=1 Tax=Yeosuana marina TaxID=1565536 RepID=UPI0030EB5AD3|tara:strand:+ start:1724 stop:2290 length:567 start_codon:yes stop_codon:yes gene_type:complete